MSDAGFYVLCLVLTAVVHGGLTLGTKWWVYLRVRQMHRDTATALAQLSQDLDEFDSRLCALVGWAQLSRAAAKDTEASVKGAMPQAGGETAAPAIPTPQGTEDTVLEQKVRKAAERVARKMLTDLEAEAGAVTQSKLTPLPVPPPGAGGAYPRPPSGRDKT